MCESRSCFLRAGYSYDLNAMRRASEPRPPLPLSILRDSIRSRRGSSGVSFQQNMSRTELRHAT
eukprot:4764863-Pyramimonas_sp.AAC.1